MIQNMRYGRNSELGHVTLDGLNALLLGQHILEQDGAPFGKSILGPHAVGGDGENELSLLLRHSKALCLAAEAYASIRVCAQVQES